MVLKKINIEINFSILAMGETTITQKDYNAAERYLKPFEDIDRQPYLKKLVPLWQELYKQ